MRRALRPSSAPLATTEPPENGLLSSNVAIGLTAGRVGDRCPTGAGAAPQA